MQRPSVEKSLFLYFLSIPYGFISRFRNLLFDFGLLSAKHCKLPVISVGNITAGGTGKTPIVMFIALELAKRGRKPVVLSRGYGGKIYGPHQLSKTDTPKDVGDEPYLMARRLNLPVIVAKNRYEGARFISESKLGDIVILDDGFQHRWLYRNVDIVTINVTDQKAIDDFIAGLMLPLGRFREDRDIALRRANIVLLSSRGNPEIDNRTIERMLPILPKSTNVYKCGVAIDGIYRSIDDTTIETFPSEVVAFCGIANPEGFFSSVKALGIKIVGEKCYPDHFAFTRDDIDYLSRRFGNAPLLCTEKDAVKIKDSRVLYLRIGLATQTADALIVDILKRI